MTMDGVILVNLLNLKSAILMLKMEDGNKLGVMFEMEKKV